MGGSSDSTSTMQPSPLQQLFASQGGQGYQQMPIGQIQAPQLPTPAQTPEQAAQATVARMLARTPPAPGAAPAAPAQPGGYYEKYPGRNR